MASELSPAVSPSGRTSRLASTLGSHNPRRFVERPLLFGRHETLVGVFSAPNEGVHGAPVLLLAGGIIHRVGPSRSLVHLARVLSAAGHPCLRFDLSGVGDSARASEASLQEAVVADIRDAIGTLLAHGSVAGKLGPQERVTLVGFCSGADNALHVAEDDPRVGALVLFDPTVHRTSGFRRREFTRRLHSHDAFVNLVSGRSLMKRLEALRERNVPVFPPGHYGLLVSDQEVTDAKLESLSRRHVQRLWVLSRDALRYCNAPEQVEEAYPNGWNGTLDTIDWAMDFDHVLSSCAMQHRFAEMLLRWLASARPRSESD